MNSACILVVDDEAIVAMDLESRLQRLGYRTVGPIGTADGAIRLAGEKRPDLALMDINLGGNKDGIDAARALRHEFDIPVVYLTAYADERTVSRAKSAEPLGYILKPFEERELQATIEVALHKQKADQAQRRLERWLAATLRSIADAVVTVDRAGRVTSMNAMAEILLGCRATEIVGRALPNMLTLREGRDDRDVDALLKRAIEGEVVVDHSNALVLIGRGGGERPVDCSLAPIRDVSDEVIGAIVILRDMSGVRITEQRRRKSNDGEQQQWRMAGIRHLAGGMSHNFNNLLTVILGCGDRLRDMIPAGDERESAIEELLQALERAVSFARQIRDVSGEALNHRTKVDSHNLLVEKLGLIQSMVGDDITVVASFEATRMVVDANRSQLEQAIIRLAIRARAAMPGGGTLRIEVVTAALKEENLPPGSGLEPGRHVVFRITDSGPALPPEALARIFEPVSTVATLSQGTWLGLADVFGLIVGNGGAITAEAAPERGTMFKIYLPQVAA